MNPMLRKALVEYADELVTRGPVHNGSHHTLKRLWDTYGREAVDQAIATMPEFQRPCRRPYTLRQPVPNIDQNIKALDAAARDAGWSYPMRTAVAGYCLNWRAVVGKLLAALQTAGFTLERTDDGEVSLLACGTPRHRRQQIKAAVVNSDRSHVTVSVNGRKLWLCIDLRRKPYDCVVDHSDDYGLAKVVTYFKQHYA